MKDLRFNTVRKLIKANEIQTFSEILETIPKTTLALSMNLNPKRFNRLLANVELFVMKDLRFLADLLEVESIEVLKLVDNELNMRSRKKK